MIAAAQVFYLPKEAVAVDDRSADGWGVRFEDSGWFADNNEGFDGERDAAFR